MDGLREIMKRPVSRRRGKKRASTSLSTANE